MVQSARLSSSVKEDLTGDVPFRVVIVEESAVIRGMMSRWLGESGRFDVVARFGTAKSVLDKIKNMEAEVVVLDVDTPKLNGANLLPQLLNEDPTLQIMAVTASGSGSDARATDLKEKGAHAVLVRPAQTREVTTSQAFRDNFLKSVEDRGLYYRRTNSQPRSKTRREQEPPPPTLGDSSAAVDKSRAPAAQNYNHPRRSAVKPRILAVGSSTGGPKALYEVFASLKGSLTVPVVIAQHMPPLFTGILAEHLTKASGCVAKEGEHGEKVLPGHIYVAPGDHHMILQGTPENLTIELNQDPEENFCRPAVDPMFRSVAKIFGPSALCLILTGMGQDGCKGAQEIVDAGGTVVSQDEATSVVWGMPGAVAKAGLSAEILPLLDIGPRVNSFLKGTVK